MNYSGSPFTALTEKEGMESPVHHWTPSIAVSGIDIYQGQIFHNWKNDLFAGGLSAKELHRLRTKMVRL